MPSVRSVASLTRSAEIEIVDLSQRGIGFTAAARLRVGDRIEVLLPCVGAKCATVTWLHDQRYGCDFVVPLRFQDVERSFVRRTRIHPV